jgi:hypothetical protein
MLQPIAMAAVAVSNEKRMINLWRCILQTAFGSRTP